jgi:hypothetical protein
VPVVYYPSPGDFVDQFMKLSVRAPLVFDRQSEKVQLAIRADIENALAQFRTAEGLAIPAPAIIASGVAV